MKEIKIDVAGTIRRLRHQNFSLQAALREMIDNSLDAKATRVFISEQDRDLFISDNGEGIADVGEAFNIGRSDKVDEIGRFGVGMKDASVKYSEETTIISNGQQETCSWEDAMATGAANLQSEICESVPGTQIIWRGFRNLYRYPIETAQIRRCYATSETIIIEVNGLPIQPLPLPTFNEFIEEEFLYEGKRVRLSGGIFPPNDPNRKDWVGYHLYYRQRLIGRGRITTAGMGDICCSNFCFLLHLYDVEDEKWHLGTNKDYVAGSDELLDFVFHTYTRELLKHAEEQAQDINLNEIAKAIEADVNSSNGNITRTPRKRYGTRKPIAKQGTQKINTFTANEPGEYQANGKKKRSDLKLLFASLNERSIGEMSIQANYTLITLNKDNSFIADHLKDFAVMRAVAILAYSMKKALPNDLFPAQIVDSTLDIAGDYLNNISAEELQAQ